MNTFMQQESLQESPSSSQYEAPRIEVVLTPEELEREVLYAIVGSMIG